VIRVFIADDQNLVRQGIRTLLEMDEELFVVGEASDGKETVALVPTHQVDVLLLDVRMPHKSGIEALRELSAKNALPPTLILTTFDDSNIVLEGIRAGARGFMLKDASYQQLTAAIRAIAGGAADRVRIETTIPAEPLTQREIEVIRLVSGGYSNQEVAYALGTAEGTVKNHVSNILGKLAVRDRTRAVLKALELGLL
jgi:DNA-binding NarL/FixJ family response regulator